MRLLECKLHSWAKTWFLTLKVKAATIHIHLKQDLKRFSFFFKWPMISAASPLSRCLTLY